MRLKEERYNLLQKKDSEVKEDIILHNFINFISFLLIEIPSDSNYRGRVHPELNTFTAYTKHLYIAYIDLRTNIHTIYTR